MIIYQEHLMKRDNVNKLSISKEKPKKKKSLLYSKMYLEDIKK